ncbi:hypothetical protein AB4094_17625 [Acidithiobacillus ferrianus]
MSDETRMAGSMFAVFVMAILGLCVAVGLSELCIDGLTAMMFVGIPLAWCLWGLWMVFTEVRKTKAAIRIWLCFATTKSVF